VKTERVTEAEEADGGGGADQITVAMDAAVVRRLKKNPAAVASRSAGPPEVNSGERGESRRPRDPPVPEIGTFNRDFEEAWVAEERGSFSAGRRSREVA